MKFDWAKLVREMRKAAIDCVEFKGVDAEHSMDLHIDFKMLMRQTDQFHAWDMDEDLERAFRKLETKCNYRSCKSYWAYKNSREHAIEAIADYLDSMFDIIDDYYGSKWNFAPGYVKPKKIDYADSYAKAAKIFPRVIRTVKQ
jgi:hypothetical protein